MLSVAEEYIRRQNRDAHPYLYGQDLNDEAWAVCRSDMLIKGENAENIHLGDTFTHDALERREDGTRWTFDYMLANPPFGVEWKQQQRRIQQEHEQQGFQGRFGAGLPRINDGSLLFLQHMLAKMQAPGKARSPNAPQENGSRIAIVFNGSPLFTGDAGSGESNIRRWIIENDWLEAIVALPDQLFYNTGIATYIWVLTNRKERRRKGKVQLVDARRFFVKMKKSLGNKRNKIGDKDEGEPDQIGEIARIHGDGRDGETRTFVFDGVEKSLVVSRVFDNEDFGYRKITVERPLRLSFQASPERIALLEEEPAFRALATSARKAEKARLREIEEGRERQEEIRGLVRALARRTGGRTIGNRAHFLSELREAQEAAGVRLSVPETKAVVAALGERDATAEICRDRHGNPEPDPELRDTETVLLKEPVADYVAREVLPHVPGAWVDDEKTKIGYEIPLNRHFYRYEPPRPLEAIEADLKRLEGEIVRMLAEVTGGS